MNSLFNLTGKNILFTAAGSYLGRAMSESLAEYGANVILTSRDTQKVEQMANYFNAKYKGNSIGICLDITNLESVKQSVLNIINTYGSIDVLVNNANFSSTGMLHEMSHEKWINGIDGTINSVFNIIHEVLPYMIKKNSGNIINISSMYGMVSPDYRVYHDTEIICNPPNYGAGKAAIIQFTKYIACFYGKYGMRANSISPGAFPDKKIQKNKKFIKNLSEMNPLNRIGYPEDLKSIIVFLASDSSSYITGQNIAVDGGWTSW